MLNWRSEKKILDLELKNIELKNKLETKSSDKDKIKENKPEENIQNNNLKLEEENNEK